ncbi:MULTISPECIES: hypothetical protein [Ruminococcus]|uniref:Uncharacterized protein n=1 Tax=Ruminococcus bovis TaxID=2564099 RepID=A0A4P8XWY3_9FIRM|nr:MULTISPECIES: hypothetical protein [Ruminococcus]MEE3439171.1 hypothetical protein [Ruminococcus sp.]QCT07661.1 hypothetical protein E5Z56_09975 [Ruminococcus bovis]
MKRFLKNSTLFIMAIVCLSPLGHLILACINAQQNHFLRLSIISLVCILVLLVFTYFYAKYSKQLRDEMPLKMKKVVLDNGKSISIPKNWSLLDNEGKLYINNENNKVAVFQSENKINFNEIFTSVNYNVEQNPLSDNFKCIEILTVEKVSNDTFKGVAKVSVDDKIRCMNYFILDDLQFFATSKVSNELLLDIVLSYE